MRILHSMDEFDGPGCVVALGTFDGVHLGHALLIRRTVALARALDVPAAALTFDRHPLALIRPDAVPPPLTSQREKEELMAGLGLDVLVEEPFTAGFAAQTPEQYIARIVSAMRPRAIAAGFNHTYGRFGRGDAALLRALSRRMGFEAVIVEPLCVDGEPVSSSRIRALLAAGQRAEAEKLAGHALADAGPNQKFSNNMDLQRPESMV